MKGVRINLSEFCEKLLSTFGTLFIISERDRNLLLLLFGLFLKKNKGTLERKSS